MRKVLLIILLLLACLAVWFFVFNKNKKGPSGPKPQPITVSRHSGEFNQSFNAMIDDYINMTEAFVNWDTVSINKYGAELKAAIDNLKMDDLRQDTVIYETALSYWDNSKAELQGLTTEPDLAKKRTSLNTLSQNLYDLLRTVRYDQGKIYLQECPMAFGDDAPGNWLSKTDAVRNPYLGLHHPKYGKNMVDCGGAKDTLNFMAVDSSKK